MKKLCLLPVIILLLAGCASQPPVETTVPTETTLPVETTIPLSPEAQVLFDKYEDLRNTTDTTWRPPTKEELQNNVWYYDGFSPEGKDTTYWMETEEDALGVGWLTAEEERKTYENAPWTLENKEAIAVFTVDFQELAGLRTYHVLYNPEFEMLYIAIAFDREELNPAEEPQFRFLWKKLPPAPEDMVGIWERTHTEVEGDKQETPAGECTLWVTRTEAGFCLDYTDKNYPNYDLNALPMTLQTPNDWSCFSGCDWVCVTEETEGITRYVAMTKPNVLLLVNYFTVDGAPAISYEWFARGKA